MKAALLGRRVHTRLPWSQCHCGCRAGSRSRRQERRTQRRIEAQERRAAQDRYRDGDR